jgi:methionyl-tRNA formyltransferase
MKVVFMGTPHPAVASLSRLMLDGHEIVAVYTQPDRPSGRGNKIAFSPVKRFAVDHDIPTIQPSKVRTPEALAEFSALRADVAVVVAYGRILPETFLKALPMGAINVHFSLLPKYRGAAPVNWAIVHGEEKTGVTTMQMDAGLDTGPILMQRETSIGDGETSVELMQRLSVLGADLLSETLANYPTLRPTAQNEMEASLAPPMKKEDGLISWMLDATEISHRVRGFQPFPSAFTFYKGKKLTVWRARQVQGDHEMLQPGEVITASGDEFLVFCGGGSVLRVEELQLEGKRRMMVRDFINGLRPVAGDILGS